MYRFAIQFRFNVLYVHKSCRIQWCYFKETMWRDFYPFFGQKTPLGPLINWQKRIGELFDSGRHLRKFILGVVFDYANMMLRRRCLCGHYVGKLLFLALLWTLMFIIIFYNFFLLSTITHLLFLHPLAEYLNLWSGQGAGWFPLQCSVNSRAGRVGNLLFRSIRSLKKSHVHYKNSDGSNSLQLLFKKSFGRACRL